MSPSFEQESKQVQIQRIHTVNLPNADVIYSVNSMLRMSFQTKDLKFDYIRAEKWTKTFLKEI